MYTVEFKTRWSDFDMNRHMRHTAYNDYAAESRIRFFSHLDLSIEEIAKDGFGPVLFSENTVFKKEIHSEEDITVTLQLKAVSEDRRKWKFRHMILNKNKEVCAIIEVFGAWLDLNKRKITSLPEKYDDFWNHIDKTDDFEII